MFNLCEMMKWSHLPVAGGIYDQHPKLIDDFEFIHNRRMEYEVEQSAKNKPKRTR